MSHVIEHLTVSANGAMHPSPPPDPARDWPEDLAALLKEGRRQRKRQQDQEAADLADSRVQLHRAVEHTLAPAILKYLPGPERLWHGFRGTGTHEIPIQLPEACEIRTLWKHHRKDPDRDQPQRWERIAFTVPLDSTEYMLAVVPWEDAATGNYYLVQHLTEALLLAVELRQHPPTRPEPPKPLPLSQGEILLDKLRDYILHLASPWGG